MSSLGIPAYCLEVVQGGEGQTESGLAEFKHLRWNQEAKMTRICGSEYHRRGLWRYAVILWNLGEVRICVPVRESFPNTTGYY